MDNIDENTRSWAHEKRQFPGQTRDYRVRYWMVLLAVSVAVLLYLDRICLSTASESVERDLNLSSDKLKWILSAFFWTYAFAQLPAGWLGDRFGARWVLAGYVALWSLSTALLGFAAGVTSLLVLRLACGLFEAGAYPVCAGIVRRWVPAAHRGLASGIVSVGGRLGGAVAPLLTIELMLWFSYGQSSFSLDPNIEPVPTSWRPVMMIYGGLGIVIAGIFAWLYRDSPRHHPLVTDYELSIINSGEPSAEVAFDENAREPENTATSFRPATLQP
ncbi:MAG: MFS transporter, partial [Aureliella sp.]